MQRDIAIIGGGPAGLLSAISAAKKGVDVVLFESKDEIGKHEHCAGLLSIEGLRKLGLSELPESVIQNRKIRGAFIYSPSGEKLKVEKPSTHAVVVDRAEFNRHLANIAESVGVEISLTSRVKRIKNNKDSLTLELGKQQNHKKINCEVAILAEGRYPKLNSQVGLPTPSREKMVFASQYIIENIKNLDEEYVELYLSSKYAPGFFAWIIPIDDVRAKIGLAANTKNVGKLLKAFYIQNHLVSLRTKNAIIIKKMSGAIPLGSFIKRTYTERVLVIGDAAGQTKPTTGGGVIFGGIAAKIAGDIAAEAVLSANYTLKHFAQYQKRWQKEFKRELMTMSYIRGYLNSLEDKEYDKLIKLLNQPKIKKKFGMRGDVDIQSNIAISLLKTPKLWPFIMKTGTKYVWKSIINT